MPALLSSLRRTASAGARLLQPRCLSTGSEKLFLGLDSSTQGLKATALNEQMEGEHPPRQPLNRLDPQ